jgi:hypothetical protein
MIADSVFHSAGGVPPGAVSPKVSGGKTISFMNKFRRLGFIDYNGGGLEAHSSLLNVVLHD